MIFHATPLADLFEIETRPRGDERGQFTRYYCEQALAQVSPGARVLQINHSFTQHAGTVRGLHYQAAEGGNAACEGKLVRCLRGRVWDVAVDLRRGSPTVGHWHAVEMHAEAGGRQLWIPPGFAHGFQALCDEVEMLYLHTAAYAPAQDAGLRFDDPTLAVAWPLPARLLSPRDQALPLLQHDFEGVQV